MELKLTKNQKSSLINNINSAIRKKLGTFKSPYSERDIEDVINELHKYYQKYNKHKLLELWNSPVFMGMIKKMIVDMLEDRCTIKQLNYYRYLVAKFNLPDKGTMNRQKLAQRISKIIDSNGMSQDVK